MYAYAFTRVDTKTHIYTYTQTYTTHARTRVIDRQIDRSLWTNRERERWEGREIYRGINKYIHIYRKRDT